MTNVIIVNRDSHRALRVQPRPSAQLGDAQRFVSVVVNEFPFLVAHYPIFFSKDSGTGQFYCGAVLGFDDGENLFLDEGAPRPDAYRPLNLQRGPFFTAGDELAIDLDNPRVGIGEVLFESDGTPTLYLEGIKTTMRELKQGEQRTKVFVDTLLGLKLVEAIELDIGFDDGSKRQITGLYTIAQDALRALPDAAVLDLFRRGYLNLIYLMLASMRQVSVLAQTKNRKLQAGTEMLRPPTA